MDSNKKTSSTTTALIAVIVLQLAIIGYLVYSNISKKTEIEDLTTTIDTKGEEMTAKIQELDSLNVEFERVKRQREALGLNNDSLNVQIEELNRFKKEAMATGKINAQQKRKLEGMIASLKEELVAKDKEIAELSASNKDLESKVNDLSTEKGRINDSLSGVSSVKKDLENQLAYASILKTEGLKFYAIKENGKELEGGEFKHNKISQMKIKFKIDDNKAAKKGDKTFYIAVIPPSGKTFSDPVNGGGSFTSSEGEQTEYTFSQVVNFANTNEEITFLIPKGFIYTEGKFTTKVYCEGYNIGGGTFDVK